MLDHFRRNEGSDQLELFEEEQENRGALRIAVLMVALVILALVSSAVLADEIFPPENYEGRRSEAVHSKYHQKYMKMHNQLGTHCCNDGDCRPTTARWNQSEGIWEAKLDGRWTKIASSRHVMDAYGLTDFAHVCADASGYLYCFIPPNNGF